MEMKQVKPYKDVVIKFGTDTKDVYDFLGKTKRKYSVYQKDGKEISFEFDGMFAMFRTFQKVKAYIDEHLEELQKIKQAQGE